MQCVIIIFILFIKLLLQLSETMSAENEVKFSLRVLIDKEANKVLFAEVDSHFADTLISFLALPLGTIVRLLKKHYGDDAPFIGSLNTLYGGLENLDISNFWNEAGKQMLLNPKNTFEAHRKKLKLNIDDTEPTKYFICSKRSCWNGKDSISASMYCGTKCGCGSSLDLELELSSSCNNEVSPGVFTAETASFILSDDLQMMPNSVEFSLKILNNVGINGIYGIEEKTVVVGYQEVMDLLKGSLISKTPLTDLIFPKTQRVSFSIDSVFSSKTGINATTSTSKKITVKAIVQKSTGKLLLTQTNGDFVDFLFSLLTIPLGGVLSLLGGDSSFGSIHNLYRSLESLNSNRYLKILNPFKTPYIPLKYLSKYQLLPVVEQPSPYCHFKYNPVQNKYITCFYTKKPSVLGGSDQVASTVVKDPKDHESYIKLPVMFSVSDDLVVKPSSAILGISILSSLKIPIQDIEEHVIDIGMEEALSILHASLFSKSALTDSLKHLLMKQPKEEK